MEDNQQFLNPIPFLEELKGKKVNVRLKWGQSYKGMLLNYDDYMNIQVNQKDGRC